MRYPGDRHVLPLFGPWRWAPYMRGKFYCKKYQNTRSFFLSHTSKLYQHKQWNAVPKGTAKIDPSNKYNIFPSFIIDQSWNTLQLKNIVLSFHPPFEPITALFTFTGLWPLVLKKIEVKNERWRHIKSSFVRKLKAPGLLLRKKIENITEHQLYAYTAIPLWENFPFLWTHA